MPSSIELDLAAAEARVAELQAAKAARDAALAGASVPMQKLAIVQHSQFCAEHNPSTGKCDWGNNDNYPDDYTRCDWTSESHRKWLEIAINGVSAARQLCGFTIIEPTE